MLDEQVEAIRSREDLSRFVLLLANDLRDHLDEWQNTDLFWYLESLSAWIDSMDGLYRNVRGTHVPEQPTWGMFGEMLLAAKYYE